jgi:RHS repeat-associated protein
MILRGKTCLMAIVPLLLVIICGPLSAQDPAADPPSLSGGGGSSATSSFALDRIESVNSINGNMSLRIPAAHLPPGPAGLSVGVDLVYNSTIFDLQTSVQVANIGNVLSSTYTPSIHGGGWNYSYKYTLWSQPRLTTINAFACSSMTPAEKLNWYKTMFATPDGANHPLRLVSAIDSNGVTKPLSSLSTDATNSYDIFDYAGYGTQNCSQSTNRFLGTLIFATADSSYIRVEADTVGGKWVAYFADGTKVSGSIIAASGAALDSDADTMTDRNGNNIKVQGACTIGKACTETLTDGAGRSVVVNYASPRSDGTWTDTLQYPGPNGTLTTSVNWKTAAPYQLPYYCQSSGTGSPTSTACILTQSPSVVSSIQLPAPAANGNAINYQMDYGKLDSLTYSWGELHSLILCTTIATGCQAQWTEHYIYQFDTLSELPSAPSPKRPPGTLTNPISSKTITYYETLLSSTTKIEETTGYFITVPGNEFQYPTVGGPGIIASQVSYPDGSYSEIFTANLCPSTVKARDLCPAMPYKIINRDGSVTQFAWVSNTAPAGVPTGALFNPYVQYTVETPLNATVSRIRYALQDGNGNTTTLKEWDWATTSGASTVLQSDANGLMTAACGGTGCTLLRTTTADFANSTSNYWLNGVAGSLRAPNHVTRGASSISYTYDGAYNPLTATAADDENTSSTGSGWGHLSNGNVSSSHDPDAKGISVTAWTTCGGVSLYPKTVVTGGTLSKTYDYSCDSGVLNSVTDTDNNLKTKYTYDNLGRTIQVAQSQTTSGTTRATDIEYDDLNLAVTTRQDDGTSRLVNTTYFDALGRVQSTLDPLYRRAWNAYRYGANGTTYELTSNPYGAGGTGDVTMGWTLTSSTVGTGGSNQVQSASYDGATMPGPWGSNTSQTGSVSATSSVSISSVTGCVIGAQTTDGAKHVRTNCVDALGRLVAVLEPDGMLTKYQYDALDNLTQVTAECLDGYSCSPVGSTGQTRTFTYSTVSQLRTATNPESGQVSYSHYANGNLKDRTDANGSKAAYTYDSLNRPIGIQYTPAANVSGTPDVSFNYFTSTSSGGFVGALSSVSSAASKTEYTYDSFGRIGSSKQTTPATGTAYAFSNYGYTSTDQLTSLTYPSGRVVRYTLDAADQVTAVSGAANSSVSYASNIGYTAAGDFSSLTFANGITEGHNWNSRLQHTGISAGSLLKLDFKFCPGGQDTCASGNTGSPFQQTITIGGQPQAIQTYQHDALNRLSIAAERTGLSTFNPICPDSASVWCRQFTYDNTGNRKIAANSLPTDNWDVTSFNSKNQVSSPAGWTYDNDGNLTKASDATLAVTIGYDAENRQVAFCTNMAADSGACPNSTGSGRTRYVYDGLGNRVQKIDQNGNATTYVYDAFGNLAAEYAGPVSTAGTQYVTVDDLGSTRLVMTGTQATERHDFEPFGRDLPTVNGLGNNTWRAQISAYGSGDLRQRFTGQERDPENTLDYFNARYFTGAQGRFLSPDPRNAGANPADPQSWNGYSYVSNNPLTFTDPSGLGFWSDFGGFLLKVGLNMLTGGLNNFFSGAMSGAISSANSGPWNEQLPISGGGFGGGLNTGGVFGSGNTGPFVFSISPDEAILLQTTGGLGRGASIQSPFWSTVGLLFNFLTGTGPTNRHYGPGDYRTQSLMQSKGFQQNMQRIAGACQAGQTSGKVELGTAQGGLNLPYDAVHSPVGAQVGGYAGGTWAANGNSITMTIPNEAGARSFLYHAAPNSPFSVGPMRTINQKFDITVSNPCAPH